MSLKDVLDKQTEAVKVILKMLPEISPMVITIKDNICKPTLVFGGREEIKKAIEFASTLCPDYLITINEGYMEKIDKKNKTKEKIEELLENHVIGSLERRFSDGDKSVIEVVSITVYSPEGKLMRNLSKDNLEQIEEDCDEFGGFLTVNDIDRVF